MTRRGGPPAVLSLRGVTKSYATPVLEDVDLDVGGGEVHALLGANGAGKTTLARIVSGLVRPDAGSMTLAGRAYRPASKAGAEREGVQIVQQELNAISNLTVAENLCLNRLPRRLGFVSYGRLEREARRAMALVGLAEIEPSAPIESLGVGQLQLVEIAAALARECRVLILDEPTAALTSREVERLFAELRRFRSSGVGIIYISHRLDEVRAIADRATILRDGRVAGTFDAGELTVDDMVSRMAGPGAAVRPRRDGPVAGEVALRVEHLTREPAFRDVSFTVRRGERLGIAGLVGSGRTELLRAIFGADRADSGALFLGAARRPMRFRHPREAAAAGLALVTENRKDDGLLMPQPLRVNVTLATVSRYRRRLGLLDRRAEAGDAGRMAAELDVRSSSLEQPAEELSGGNQQKVVVGKWLLRDADVVLLDEPTRGIDVAARAQLHGVLGDLAARGKALVIVSSDLDELVAICDRIVVMSAGGLAAEFERGDWSHDRIMEAAFSGYVRRRDRQTPEDAS